MAQFLALPVACGSSVVAQFNDMTLVNVWQSSADFRLAGLFSQDFWGSVSDLTKVDA